MIDQGRPFVAEEDVRGIVSCSFSVKFSPFTFLKFPYLTRFAKSLCIMSLWLKSVFVGISQEIAGTQS